jgi:ferredoxin
LKNLNFEAENKIIFMRYKVNKDKCLGCGSCVAVCLKGMKMESDAKAKIIDQKELKKCGGESICPFGAIEKIEEKNR